MNRINVNLFPKSGFIYKESDGTTIAGSTWDGVVNRVRAYRKRAGLPPGDPENEVRAQACQRDPVLCTNDDGSHARAVKVATLKGRVLQWFSRIKAGNAREPIQLAFTEVMYARANVCASCPMNQPLPEGCSSCKSALEELRVDIIGARPTDGRLVHHGCNVLGADLATQAWIESPTVENAELPAHCWRKRTL
jgi:hypothetical protein